MINKLHFGKRIAVFRRKQNLSQAELAEKLGVSAQAVSKWETAMAFPDIELLLELSKLYGVSINELLEDSGVFSRISCRTYKLQNDIAYFVPPSEYVQWENDMRDERWIERNWRDAWNQPGGWGDSEYGRNAIGDRSRTSNLQTGQLIADRGGIILEIGAGPGGGYMPFILQADPTAQIIISDMSHTVVEEWKKLLDKELDSPHLYYAALNFCSIPFNDCSIDIVSDHGGIINCIGDRSAALREVYRILKPGGLFVSLNGFITKETLAALPEHAQQSLLRKYPEAFDNLYEDTVLAGFRKIDSVVQGVWSTDEDQSGIADFARELGVNVQFTEYVRYCQK